MSDDEKIIVKIGVLDGTILVAKQRLGYGSTSTNVSEAVTDAIRAQCRPGQSFYFAEDRDTEWKYVVNDEGAYVLKVDSSPPFYIGLQHRKDVKAWIPRFNEAMKSLPDARRIPNLWNTLPDKESEDLE